MSKWQPGSQLQDKVFAPHGLSNFNSISIHWVDMSIWFQLHLQSLFWHDDT
jgi:hypothetical protein